MSQTLTISDSLFAKLADAAQQQGFKNIPQLLEAWQDNADDRERRQRTVARIDALRSQLEARYGEMPDSADLVSEDRTR